MVFKSISAATGAHGMNPEAIQKNPDESGCRKARFSGFLISLGIHPVSACQLLFSIYSLFAIPVVSAQAGKNPLTIPTGREDSWKAEHEKHKQKARTGAFDIVFIGDSITERWRYPAEGKAVWDRKLAPLNAGEFGISGDGTQSVLWRLKDGELADLKPTIIVLLIGTNHIQSSQPAEIVEGVTAVVNDLRQRLPLSKILLMGLLPRKHSTDPPHIPANVREVNAAIAKLDDNGRTVRFLDLGRRFLHSDGTLISDTMIDGLHLSPKGYEIWAEGVMMPIAELMRPPDSPAPRRTDAAALRRRAVDVMRAAMKSDPIKSMHAAEALIWNGYTADPVAHTLRLLKDAKPPMLIGHWRVLAQAQRKPRDRRRYVNKVRDAALDPKSKHAEFSVESLAKLGYGGHEPRFVDLARSGSEVMQILARWILANSGAARDEAYLTELYGLKDSRMRGIVSYALRFLPKLRPATLTKLREVAKKEPPRGEGRVFHATTLYTHDPKGDRKALKEELFRFAATGTPEEKYQSLLSVGKWADKVDLPRLEAMLTDADADVRIAAAHAILTILKRAPASS